MCTRQVKRWDEDLDIAVEPGGGGVEVCLHVPSCFVKYFHFPDTPHLSPFHDVRLSVIVKTVDREVVLYHKCQVKLAHPQRLEKKNLIWSL